MEALFQEWQAIIAKIEQILLERGTYLQEEAELYRVFCNQKRGHIGVSVGAGCGAGCPACINATNYFVFELVAKQLI